MSLTILPILLPSKKNTTNPTMNNFETSDLSMLRPWGEQGFSEITLVLHLTRNNSNEIIIVFVNVSSILVTPESAYA
jgi:hypothetical protein